MALEPTTVIKLFAISMLFPASGFTITDFVKRKYSGDPRHVNVIGLVLALYISFTWRLVLNNNLITSTPLLNLPLGRSPLLLIIYTTFVTGILAHIIYDIFKLEERGQKLIEKHLK